MYLLLIKDPVVTHIFEFQSDFTIINSKYNKYYSIERRFLILQEFIAYILSNK